MWKCLALERWAAEARRGGGRAAGPGAQPDSNQTRGAAGPAGQDPLPLS